MSVDILNPVILTEIHASDIKLPADQLSRIDSLMAHTRQTLGPIYARILGIDLSENIDSRAIQMLGVEAFEERR